MARITIELPSNYIFEYTLPVRVTDLNYGGHVGNERFLAYVQEARYRFFESLGHTETDFDGGVGIILADSAVVYKKEVFAGDELLIQMGVTDFNKYGFDFVYRLSRKKDGQEVAIAKTGAVCYHYGHKKISQLPEWLKTIFQKGSD